MTTRDRSGRGKQAHIRRNNISRKVWRLFQLVDPEQWTPQERVLAGVDIPASIVRELLNNPRITERAVKLSGVWFVVAAAWTAGADGAVIDRSAGLPAIYRRR